jgi:drug/metabolite transporter (DMT)-like permease
MLPVMTDPTVPPGSASRAVSVLWDAPYVLLFLTVLFWSGNFIVGRWIGGTVPPIAMAFWRWAFALVLVLSIGGWQHFRRDMPVLMKQWPLIVVLSIFGVASFNTLVYIGLHSTTAINALMLQSVIPMVIILCSFVMFHEKIRAGQAWGIALSFFGVTVIATQGSPGDLFDLALNPGDVWVLAAVLSYSLYSVLLRRRPAVHPFSFLVATFAIGDLCLLPLYLWEHANGARIDLGLPAVLAIGYVALFPGFFSYLFFNRGVDLVGANKAGQFIHLMPALGSVMAIALLGESFQVFHIAGIALIGLGITIATSRGYSLDDWLDVLSRNRRR